MAIVIAIGGRVSERASEIKDRDKNGKRKSIGGESRADERRGEERRKDAPTANTTSNALK